MTSHELRTPLTPMLGMLETLQSRWEELPPDRARDLLDVVSRQASRLRHLLDDLLLMSSVTAGRLTAVPEDVEVAPAVREAVLAMLGPDADVAVVVPAAVRVRVDPQHLQQMLQNYLSNAGKYATEGPERVEVLHREDAVELWVEEGGPGVPATLVPELFEPFTQLDRGDRRTSKGTGLGLAVVRALTQVNGGHAWYEARDDGGSRFCLSLPAVG